MFKSVSLPAQTWEAICRVIDSSPSNDDHRFASVLREQLDGSVKVTATRHSIKLKAGKGGDLRGFLGLTTD